MNIDLKKLGHLYFIILSIGSIIFYKERTLYMDCAIHVWNMINTRFFFVASHRYSVVIPELIPLLFIKLKTPLPVVLIAFSLSYTLLYYIIYLISAYVFKADYVIIPIMFILSVFSAQSYFHIVTETHQGLMYVILLFAWITYYNKSIGNKPLIFLIVTMFFIGLAFFAHPITLFPIAFILGFFLLNEWRNSERSKKSLVIKYCSILLITLLAYSVRTLWTPKASYDGQFYSQLKENFGPQFFKLHPLRFALHHYILYAFPCIIVLILFTFYRRSKETARLYYFAFSFFIFFAIIQLAFGKGDSDVMMEKNFMPFAIFIAIPLCYFLVNLAADRQKKIIMYLVLCSTLVGITNEIVSSKYLKKRINFYHDITAFAQEKGKHKLLISGYCAPQPAINWAISAETLLYSSLEGREHSVTSYINDGDEAHLADNNLYLFVPFWKYRSETDLNPTYFDLGHQKYVNVSCLSCPVFFPHILFIAP